MNRSRPSSFAFPHACIPSENFSEFLFLACNYVSYFRTWLTWLYASLRKMALDADQPRPYDPIGRSGSSRGGGGVLLSGLTPRLLALDVGFLTLGPKLPPFCMDT